MSKRLKHTIGTHSVLRFTIQTVDFDGVKTPTDVSTAYVYFEGERDGVKVVDKDNDPSGANVGVTIVDGPNGVVDVTLLPGDPTDVLPGDIDYGLLVRLDPGGADSRSEPIRGTLTIIAELVDVP